METHNFMRKVIKHFLLNTLIVILPLAGLYVYAEIAFKENKKKEHPTDVGLGIAIFLFFILISLFIFFIVDTIKQYRRKEYKLMAISILFISLFTVPILNIHCLMGGDIFFCDMLIAFMKSYF